MSFDTAQGHFVFPVLWCYGHYALFFFQINSPAAIPEQIGVESPRYGWLVPPESQDSPIIHMHCLPMRTVRSRNIKIIIPDLCQILFCEADQSEDYKIALQTHIDDRGSAVP